MVPSPRVKIHTDIVILDNTQRLKYRVFLLTDDDIKVMGTMDPLVFAFGQQVDEGATEMATGTSAENAGPNSRILTVRKTAIMGHVPSPIGPYVPADIPFYVLRTP
jgi:hypothetical protein